MARHKPWVIETLVPEEVYTDRAEFIDYFYNASLNAIGRRTMSTALLGQRRMGKTEIFKRVVNRLFFEQDHTDPDAAIPVYYQFPEEVISREKFALNYIENFIRWYAAFRLRDPEIVSEPEDCNSLFEIIKERMDVPKKFNHAINLWKAVDKGAVVIPEQKAVNLPRVVAARDESTIVMFLDEFQNTRIPPHGFSVTGFFQEAVESPTCPHFVTGSALSILADDLLGKGALYGRFRYKRIEPFTEYYGEELARRTARYYNAGVSEIMAPVVANRCGGNPFYITAVVRQAAERGEAIHDEETLNNMLAIDISSASGFIWAELSDQVNRWIKRVNKQGITKWILYLAASEKGDEISLERIQKELYENKIHEYKGYLAEVYMIQILWNGRKMTLPGKLFNSDEDIAIPRHFSYIDQRHRPGSGKKMEVDIYGAAGSEIWMAESKWRADKIGPDVVETLLEQAEIVREREKESLKTLRPWIFTHAGATGPARELMKRRGILWSTRAELDRLLEAVKLRKLPVLEKKREP